MYTRILSIIAIVLSCSCNTGTTQTNALVGTYYVNDFYYYLEAGFELKKEKPKNDFILYTFNFKENGEIVFKDLTKMYDCGNGVFSIDKGFWKAKENGVYELIFEGEYALESRFQTASEYTIVPMKNGNLKMKLQKVLKNEKRSYWEL